MEYWYNRLTLKGLFIYKNLDVDGAHSSMRRGDGLVIVSISLLVIYWTVSVIIGNLSSPIITVYEWVYETSLLLGYPGVLLVSFFGNATILFPFPYVGLPFVLGGLQDVDSGVFLFDPWIVGLISGIGAILGEMTGYYVGYGGSHFLQEEKMNRFRTFIENYPRATPLVIWFLAVTPIPDDMLILPLGAAKYPWWKVFIPGFFGKTMLLTGIAWGGRFGLDWIERIVAGSESGDIVSFSAEVISILIVIIILYLIIRIDWKKLGTSPNSNPYS
jgi:membrane protein YqaA with SNARE-associated domain